MQLVKTLKITVKNIWAKLTNKSDAISAAERIARLERNYLVLLKRMLEIDGIKLKVTPKASEMTSKVFQTSDDNKNNGLNEYKPTIH